MMPHEELRHHIDKRFDRLEVKVDDFQGRVSRNEEAIAWIRGHIKLSTALFLAAVGTVAAAYFGIK